MTVLAQPHRPTGELRRTAAARDLPAWESRVRRILRPTSAELVDGSPQQRRRLVATGVRRGALRAPGYAPDGTDPSAVALVDLLAPEHRDRWEADVAAAGESSAAVGDDASVLAEVMARFSGAARGRVLWVAPFVGRPEEGGGGVLGVLATDSPVAVLALQDGADVGAAPLARIDAGEPWTALVHTVGLPLVDEHGHALRDDVAWPGGQCWRGELRGGAEVWTCGSPAVTAGLPRGSATH